MDCHITTSGIVQQKCVYLGDWDVTAICGDYAPNTHHETERADIQDEETALSVTLVQTGDITDMRCVCSRMPDTYH